ncbi:hypothetical protein BDC45DRAFT_536201 [Circinella umbellata]|nr:hypothetical protein BDC45DRAFT_536201 [Circinella umbellata]
MTSLLKSMVIQKDNFSTTRSIFSDSQVKITTASGKEIGSLAQYVNQCFLYIDNDKQELQQETLDNYGDTFTTQLWLKRAKTAIKKIKSFGWVAGPGMGEQFCCSRFVAWQMTRYVIEYYLGHRCIEMTS